MIDENIIKRINELANLKKQRGLTKDESQEQQKLRQEYLKSFRTNMRGTLNNIDIVDEVVISKYDITYVSEKLSDHPSIKKIESRGEDIAITYLCKEISHEKILASLVK